MLRSTDPAGVQQEIWRRSPPIRRCGAPWSPRSNTVPASTRTAPASPPPCTLPRPAHPGRQHHRRRRPHRRHRPGRPRRPAPAPTAPHQRAQGQIPALALQQERPVPARTQHSDHRPERHHQRTGNERRDTQPTLRGVMEFVAAPRERWGVPRHSDSSRPTYFPVCKIRCWR